MSSPHPPGAKIRLLSGRAAAAMLAALLLTSACRQEPQTPVPAGAPRLVLFVVVDQLRYDYLERFRPLLTGGLDRLLEEGVVFADAHQHHNVTSTAPGHATLATGSFPASHGIVGNEWYERESGTRVYCLDDDEHGESPARMLRPTLGDRMKEAWPAAKVFAIGGKDRSATLTAGHLADAAYWYDRTTGSITTSSYYRKAPTTDSAPWLRELQDRGFLDSLFGSAWTPLLSEQQWASFGVEALDRGPFTSRFPYSLGGASAYPDRSFYSAIYSTPFVDSYLGEVAKALIEGEELGEDEVPDFLGLTFSALDAVGHGYGPDAPETLDTLLRLDRTLGEVLDFVDQQIGLDRVLVSLSADHGVGEVPEVRAARGLDSGRIQSAGVQCIQRAGQRVTGQFGLEDRDWMPALLYLDRTEIEAAGADFRRVGEALARELESCPRIAQVFSPEDIVRELDPPLDELYVNGYYAPRSPDLLLLLEPNTLFGGTVASHGQAHAYDTHVPFLLRAPGQRGGRVDSRVRTVDVAPTLLGYLGLELAEADGEDLRPLLPSS